MVTESGPLGPGARAFRRLGRSIVAHPVRPIVAWIVILGLALPLLAHLGGATQSSATTLPSDAPSSVAAAELARLFPNSSAASSSLLLFTGADITGPTGQAAVLGATGALAADPRLTEIAGISSVYSSYASYLAGQGELALGTFAAAGAPPSTLVATAGNLSTLLWGPPTAYLEAWTAYDAAHPGSPPADGNYPSYAAVLAEVGNDSPAARVLTAFYLGVPGASAGFNASATFEGTGDCAAVPSAVANCTARTARASGDAVLPALVPSSEAARSVPLGEAVLAVAVPANATNGATLRSAVLHDLAAASGLSDRWLSTVLTEFPNGTASPLALAGWTDAVADGPIADYPLAVPAGIWTQFVDPADDATLVIVAFAVGDSYETSSGQNPVFADVSEIDRVVPRAVVAAAPGGTVGYVQTGPAPLDDAENTVLAQNLAIVLPLTIGILVLITLLYFRSPVAPAVTFGAIGIAIGLSLAGLVVLADVFGKVDPTTLTLANTFVLGVGTDYSIFLVARYREEIRKGAGSDEAIVTSVTWAGQSIATSGSTAVLATLALAFSGVGLLSQWGRTLSVAVALTVLVALTLVPACLRLLGPRVFWPETGERARRAGELGEARVRSGRTYFHRAGRLAQRAPVAVIAIVLLVSLPLGYLALTRPLNYDFYQQLPVQPGATQGLIDLSAHFGPGDAFPLFVLVTFPAPLLQGGVTNASEFGALSAVTTTINGTTGVASVTSPVGPYGAPLAAWLGYAAAPPAVQEGLAGTLGQYVGTDGRTVLLTVVPSSSGLSAASVALLGRLKGSVPAELAGQGEASATVAYGGGAAITADLSAQTTLATERMFLAVTIGLLVVLFAVLRSWLIPPMAVATIVLSIGWAWGTAQLVLVQWLGLSLFFFVPTVLFVLILGLGIDYNIFLLTRVREERLRGRSSREAVLEAVTRTGGIITAAALILGAAFASLSVGDFVLLKAIGFSVAVAVLLDAMVVRTYLVPSALQLLGDRVWTLRRPPAAPGPSQGADDGRSGPP